ncbi:hypothetical protein ACQR1Y_23030 [Bradyrhizobium sp. HKCCYLRH3099]|uniref:hypothetical protein n=1 Tax=unclassified Bradyrhizobium TaxID=2631580 RepID=UPI003EBD461F
MTHWLQPGRRLTLLLSVWLSLIASAACARDNATGWDSSYYAVGYCRTVWPQTPVTLSPDRYILCFDGSITPSLDVSLTKTLELGGFFVIRSTGGRVDKALELASLVRERRATVVVYDYCFSACAEFIMTAPEHTFVLKDALVLWHNPQSGDPTDPYCAFLKKPREDAPKALRRRPCSESSDTVDYSSAYQVQHFRERAIDPWFVPPPDSMYVRKRVAGLYAETGVDRDILWTLHPRFYPRLFKANIVFEAYPQSQDEVDATAARLGLKAKIIYDP